MNSLIYLNNRDVMYKFSGYVLMQARWLWVSSRVPTFPTLTKLTAALSSAI